MANTFDPVTHTYRMEGVVVPSVTEILKVLGGYEGVSPAVLEFARNRGQLVHLLCDMEDSDDIDESSVDPQLAGYLQAYRAARRDHGLEVVVGEHAMYSTRGFAGTLDRLWLVRRDDVDHPHLELSELKATANIEPQVNVQLTAYEELMDEDDALLERIGDEMPHYLSVLQLRPDGTYRFPTVKRDTPTWRSCINVFNWKKHHGR